MTDVKETEDKEPKEVDELTIIRSCMTQLRKLSPAGQARVVEYLRARAAEAFQAPEKPNSKTKDLFE